MPRIPQSDEPFETDEPEEYLLEFDEELDFEDDFIDEFDPEFPELEDE